MPRLHRLLGAILLLILNFGSAPSFAESKPIELLVGFSRNSATHLVATIIAKPMGDNLGRSVVIRHLIGDHGFRGALATHDAAPNGNTLLLADSLTLALNETAGGRPFSIHELTPIAKLTLGISVALVAREDSELHDWTDVQDTAKRGLLKLSVSGRQTAYGVAWSYLEKEKGIAFEHILGLGNGLILADVANGRSDLGIVTTNTIEGFNAVSEHKLKPIVTFGAKRSPRYPETPTFAEITVNEKNDFTYSFSLFGPPGLPDQTVERLKNAIQATIALPHVKARGEAHGIDLVHNGPEVVDETIARDLRVARSVSDYFDSD